MILASETDKAYIAGIVDGEGCFLITERGRPPTRRCLTPSFIASISVSMVDTEAIQFMAGRYKGRITYFNPDRKLPYQRFDVACHAEVKALLDDIQPYLKVKSIQATVMQGFLDLPTFKGGVGRTVPDNIVDLRRFFSTEIKRANQRKV